MFISQACLYQHRIPSIMFIELLKFEAFYQRKQWAYLIFSILFLLFGYLLGSQSFAEAKVNYNSVTRVTFDTGISTLGALFSVVFFCVSGVIRDRSHKMENILYSTPIKKWHFFGSRLIGVFGFTLISFTPLMVGMALGALSPELDPSRVSDFNLLLFLRTWFFLVVPNIFICSSLVFSVSLLTKNNAATYVTGVLLYVMYMVTSIIMKSPIVIQAAPSDPETMMLASYFDPFGLSAFVEQTQYWTPEEKNFQMVSFSGYFLGNRLMWVGFGCVILGFSYHVFSFRSLSKDPQKKVKEEKEQATGPYVSVPTLTSSHMQFKSLISTVRNEIRSIFISLPFIITLICWCLIVFFEIHSRIIAGGQYGDSWYPYTNLLIEQFTEPLLMFCIILIVFYAGELVWRDRSNQFHEIINSSPISSAVLFISKFISLVLLPVILMLTAIIISIGFQAALGYSHFEWALYLSIFYYWGVDLVFYCLFALFVQTVTPHKYLAVGISALIIIMLKSSFSGLIGIEHPLLKLGYLPTSHYTNMNGYGWTTASFHHFGIYWMALGTVLAILAFKFWNRGSQESYQHQWHLFKANWKPWHLGSLGIFLLIFLIFGSFIFYQINIEGEYKPLGKRLDLKEEYERQYKQYKDLPRLHHVEIKTSLDLFPEEGRATIEANYRLKNLGSNPVNQVLISERARLDTIGLEGSRLVNRNEDLGVFLFEFTTPVQPGEEVNFHYILRKNQNGYKQERGIVSNGSFIFYNQFEPRLWYSAALEIDDPYERKKRGLSKREEEKVDFHLGEKDVNAGRVVFETVICTSSNQKAIAPGKLVATWEEGGRRFFHYKPTRNVVPFIAYFSADYDMEVVEHNGVSIEQYYHAGHEYNLEKIEESARMTLDYCEKYFGPYPFDHLRFVEIPGHWNFGGAAHPGTISMVEDNIYLIDISDTSNFDLVAKRTIHEVAHQWFGGVLSPKIQPGASLLVEGLAKYMEAAIMEKMYGKRMLWLLSENANRRYFTGRKYTDSTEPPLYLTEDGYLDYGKSFTVMLAMKELFGEDSINKAINQMINRYRGKDEFIGNSEELIGEFYKVTDRQHHDLIDDWFRKIFIYDLKISEVSYESLKNGKYEFLLKLSTKKQQVNPDGSLINVSMDEPLSIGFFKEHPKSLSNDQAIIYYKLHQVVGESNEIRVIVNELPEFVSIDPFGTRTDPNLHDNLKELK